MTKIYGIEIFIEHDYGRGITNMETEIRETINNFKGIRYFKNKYERKMFIREYYKAMEKYCPSYDGDITVFTDWATWEIGICMKEIEEEIKPIKMRERVH